MAIGRHTPDNLTMLAGTPLTILAGTPLTEAVESNSTAAAKLLIDAGANLFPEQAIHWQEYFN